MHLIVDSGSTKTLWCLINDDEIVQELYTLGINPYVTSKLEIQKIVLDELIPQLKAIPTDIFYYGAGCSTKENKKIIEDELLKINPIANIEVHHDLLAVARSLCQDELGIAVILGTGSNSCLYDGRNIIQNTPSLGFILGDEGSGSYIGKQLLSDYWYAIMPDDLRFSFQKEHSLELDSFLNKTYKQEAANAYLASFCRWMNQHRHHQYIKKILNNSFNTFIEKHIYPYGKSSNLKIHSIGSIAFYFADEWKEVILQHGYVPGKLEQEPTKGLINYHLKWKE